MSVYGPTRLSVVMKNLKRGPPLRELQRTSSRRLLVVYNLLEAPGGFRTGFCRVCGTSLPALVPQATALGIPVGALDNDPGGRARYHIFCGGKASWFEIIDDLPQFAEYEPPGFDWRHSRSLGQER